MSRDGNTIDRRSVLKAVGAAGTLPAWVGSVSARVVDGSGTRLGSQLQSVARTDQFRAVNGKLRQEGMAPKPADARLEEISGGPKDGQSQVVVPLADTIGDRTGELVGTFEDDGEVSIQSTVEFQNEPIDYHWATPEMIAETGTPQTWRLTSSMAAALQQQHKIAAYSSHPTKSVRDIVPQTSQQFGSGNDWWKDNKSYEVVGTFGTGEACRKIGMVCYGAFVTTTLTPLIPDEVPVGAICGAAIGTVCNLELLIKNIGWCDEPKVVLYKATNDKAPLPYLVEVQCGEVNDYSPNNATFTVGEIVHVPSHLSGSAYLYSDPAQRPGTDWQSPGSRIGRSSGPTTGRNAPQEIEIDGRSAQVTAVLNPGVSGRVLDYSQVVDHGVFKNTVSKKYWKVVFFDGRATIGWVKEDHLQSGFGDLDTADPRFQNGQGVEATRDAMVLTNPNFDKDASSRVATVPEGTEGWIERGYRTAGLHDMWKVRWETGDVGWSRGMDMQSISQDTQIQRADFEQGETVYVEGDKTANVRGDPEVAGNVIHTHPEGVSGEIVEPRWGGDCYERNQGYVWWHVDWGTAMEGWTPQRKLTTQNPTPGDGSVDDSGGDRNSGSEDDWDSGSDDWDSGSDDDWDSGSDDDWDSGSDDQPADDQPTDDQTGRSSQAANFRWGSTVYAADAANVRRHPRVSPNNVTFTQPRGTKGWVQKPTPNAEPEDLYRNRGGFIWWLVEWENGQRGWTPQSKLTSRPPRSSSDASTTTSNGRDADSDYSVASGDDDTVAAGEDTSDWGSDWDISLGSDWGSDGDGSDGDYSEWA